MDGVAAIDAVRQHPVEISLVDQAIGGRGSLACPFFLRRFLACAAESQGNVIRLSALIRLSNDLANKFIFTKYLIKNAACAMNFIIILR